MLVKVRGGYEVHYRHNLYKAGSVFEMEEGEYKGLAHLFDVVKIPEPVKAPEPEPPKEPEPEVTAEAVMDTVSHRAIVKPARSRGKK